MQDGFTRRVMPCNKQERPAMKKNESQRAETL
nr:MAG TPA: protein of unknown function (DUF5056) [Caudoviricetes sp.]